MRTQAYFVYAVLILLSGCGVFPKRVKMEDPKLKPFLDAVARVDRQKLGFTALPSQGDARLEGSGKNYDAMLHIYADTSRTISFRKLPAGGFRWTGEQEIHRGPRKYTGVDGPYREEICITYEVEQMTGVPLNEVSISYFGEDPDLAWPHVLTLEEVTPILKHWRELRAIKKS